ncbi:hypothetical protein [Staphylococcus phage SAP6]|uniref:Uncharacterized protein n=3 Tax=Silviavirus remus TaxID=1857890 RepID=A0A8E5NS40_9CAUD|nr:hypothetical protein PM56_126 [Staphylococcus phage PM56]QVD58564.1 hypothetical protein PM93_137 [Staphylococcus phage PM93]QVD58767.1 hypothetical protein Remus_136 [Silviavirus remus]QVD58958.1 hypothetical protein Romulus_126 [Staphylococcus phage Romulus]WAW11927.1 hypothetical protein [Staphylococcus phage StAP1]WAW12142.1 hypothetical protein [Staphylococcus phage SAP6]
MDELFEGEYKFLEPYINSDTAIKGTNIRTSWRK